MGAESREPIKADATKTPDAPTPKALDIQAPQSYTAYEEYSKTLRTWMVAYGIGGPVLIISQPEIATKLAASPDRTVVIYLFLVGLAAQVLMSLLNKWVNWGAYRMGFDPPTTLTSSHKVVIWLANQFWMDILSDLVSVISFVTATFVLLRLMLA